MARPPIFEGTPKFGPLVALRHGSGVLDDAVSVWKEEGADWPSTMNEDHLRERLKSIASSYLDIAKPYAHLIPRRAVTNAEAELLDAVTRVLGWLEVPSNRSLESAQLAQSTNGGKPPHEDIVRGVRQSAFEIMNRGRPKVSRIEPLLLALWELRSGLKRSIEMTPGEPPQQGRPGREAAETLGISVARTRTLCVIASGSLTGLGGAFLSLSATGVFIDNMTAGRGYIALAILMLGRRNPWGILLASLLFGGADALQLRGQSFGIGVPYQFLVMLPYLLTVVVLVVFAGRVADPAALGQPFRRARAE